MCQHEYKGTYNIDGDIFIVCKECDVLTRQHIYTSGNWELGKEYELLD